MARIDIRAFDERDRRAVVSLWTSCGLTRPWNDPDADIDRKLAVADDMFLVATTGDGPSPQVVGSVMSGYDGHRGWMNYLAVDPSMQGFGVGALLVAEAERRLGMLGCAKVNLQVRAENTAALGFYERLGYERDDVVSLGRRLVVDDPPPERAPAVAVPEVVRNKAIAHGAEEWLVHLPELVAGLERDWGISVGAPHEGGTEAFVADATIVDVEDGHGTHDTPDTHAGHDRGGRVDAVLKLLVPREGDAASAEIEVLRRVDGDGCVRLIRGDATRGALLLERLGPSMNDLGLPIAERHRILCDLARRFWRPASDADLPTGADKAAWLIDHITTSWDELDRPCSERVVEHAIACAERRRAAHDDERAVLVHGDVHEWNALSVPDRPGEFKLIDPDGLLAEPEYDLGVMMREDPVEHLADADPDQRARWFARRTGCDVTAIVEWGVVERVSTGLLAMRIDLQPVGRQMLEMAERIAGSGG